MPYLEKLDEGHGTLIFGQPFLCQECSDFNVVYLIRLFLIRLPDDLNTRILPFWERSRHINPHTPWSFRVERQLPTLSFPHLLQQRNLRVSDHLRSRPHVRGSFDNGSIDWFRRRRPESHLNGGLVVQNRGGSPDMFCKVRSYRCDEECGSADPISNKLSVHTAWQLGGDLSIPVTSSLEFVEAVFERIFVVGSLWVIRIRAPIQNKKTTHAS